MDSSSKASVETSTSYSEVSKQDCKTWWIAFVETIRECFTSNRADLEAPQDMGNLDNNDFMEWSCSTAAEVLNNSGAKSLQGNAYRDKILTFIHSHQQGLSFLMKAMDDHSTSCTRRSLCISKLLREIVNPKNGKIRTAIVKKTVFLDYVRFSVTVLKNLIRIRPKNKSVDPNEFVDPTIHNILWFLSAVANSDSSFAMKVRKMLKVKFFHQDLIKKLFFGKNAAHFPLLKILRQLSKDAGVAKTLCKDSVMSTIRRMFTSIPNQPGSKVIILLETLSQFTREKSNCPRFLKAGLIAKLMQIFAHWEIWRGKGLLRLSKLIIIIYNRLSVTKSGKKALVQCDAIMHLRKFCDQCPTEKSFDDIIMKVAALVAVVHDKDQLPLEALESPVKFTIPESDDILNRNNDTGSSSDDEGSESENEEASGNTESALNEDDEDNDDTNNDDGRSLSDDDDDDNDVSVEISESQASFVETDSNNNGDNASIGPLSKSRKASTVSGSFYMLNPPPPTPIDKLQRYNKYFNEYNQGKPPSRRNSLFAMQVQESKSDENANIVQNEDRMKYVIPSSKHSYGFLKENPDFKYWGSIDTLRRHYMEYANSIHHVAPFVKVPYPELCFGYSHRTSESFGCNADRRIMRTKLTTHIQRMVGSSFKPKEVYSLDALMGPTGSDFQFNGKLENNDEAQIGTYNRKLGLQFESRFESGNLRKAIQVGDREFDLIITSDVNSRHHNQWFYFQISNICDDLVYTFNIINCTKSNSLFNYGMQPVVFSVTDALNGKPGWLRSGSNICYFKNGYKCVSKKSQSKKVYHTLSFSLTFSHKGDIAYIAYHIPYTYSRLMVELCAMTKAVDTRSDILMRCESLCQTLNQNDVPLITITAHPNASPIEKRKVVIITGRVHPGETNASWVMKGALEFLLFSQESRVWLKEFVFKIVPMLNIEGVINGNHRCGLTSEDLNRCWKYPSEVLHPTIFHSKMIIEYCCRSLNKPPVAYIDLHGHSRRKNIFFYGCSKEKSWNEQDKESVEKDESTFIRGLPESMDMLSDAFCLSYCHYDVRKSRETTARVAVWRDFNIKRSYTLECSYCGCDRGQLKGIAFGTNHLMEIGMNLCQAAFRHL